MNHICVNGKIKPADEPALLVSNRGYRYGDGLFETMKIYKGKILLQHFHFERLFNGLSLLKFAIPGLFTETQLEKDILGLCHKNNCSELGRVRLSVSRGNGGLYDDDKTLQYIIECWQLDDSINKLNENGLAIDVYYDAKKFSDLFSPLKSASFLPYVMAAEFAKENKLNDSLVLNQFGRIADSTIANVFAVKGDTIITPGITEGCVNGVMRRALLERSQGSAFKIQEGPLEIKDIERADEVFLTNAIKGIRWVKQFRDKSYTNIKTVEIYDRFIKELYV